MLIKYDKAFQAYDFPPGTTIIRDGKTFPYIGEPLQNGDLINAAEGIKFTDLCYVVNGQTYISVEED